MAKDTPDVQLEDGYKNSKPMETINKICIYTLMGIITYAILSLFNWDINIVEWGTISHIIFICGAVSGLYIFENTPEFETKSNENN